jgi:hypothetical protein
MLLLILACVFSSEPTLCTEIGCTDGYELTFDLSTPGTWTVDVMIDGTPVHCQATLPLRETNPDGCDSDVVLLFLSGSELADAEHRITGLLIQQAGVTTVDLVIEHDGAAVYSGSFTPAYVTAAPNGEECGPVCSFASEAVDLGI